jgi:DNA-directed RNA polymerase subunit L
MKLEVIKNESDYLEFFIEGERHTLTNLLKERLSQDDKVEFVAYRLDHPLENKARFVLRAKSAKKVLNAAIKEIVKELQDFEKGFSKAN